MQTCKGICESENTEKESLREWCKKMKILETENWRDERVQSVCLLLSLKLTNPNFCK